MYDNIDRYSMTLKGSENQKIESKLVVKVLDSLEVFSRLNGYSLSDGKESFCLSICNPFLRPRWDLLSVD